MNFNQFNLDARLNAEIRRAGFHKPTAIQEAAILPALKGRDLIGTAQTGTGKTAAFVLPILQKLLSGPRKQTRALIITPTRELAMQIKQVIDSLSRGTHIRSTTIFGGVGAAKQIKMLNLGVEIIVACPGRLLDHLQNKRANLSRVEILVLDEGDRMLDMGFLPDIKRILKFLPVKRQTMLFSATFPKEIENLASQYLHDPKRISIGLTRPVHTVEHTVFPVQQHLKKKLLLKLLGQTETKSVLIFTRTKHRARRLAQQIDKTGRQVTSLHGDRTQNQRIAALKGFMHGKYKIMVATDIAARGLDIANISHVINFDMPDTADAYIHRIGRTGRAKRSGEAFTLVTPDDNDLVRKIERIMKQKIQRELLPDFDYQAVKPSTGQKTRKTQRNFNRPANSRKKQYAR